MKKKYLILIILFLCLTGLSNAAMHTVQVSSNVFSPNAITSVAVGDIIRWEYVGGTHSTVSQNIPAGAATWNAPITASVTSFQYTVTHTGTYTYICGVHGSGMSGSFTTDAPTSLVEKGSMAKASFEISPNPASDLLNMKFSSDQAFRANLFVFDEQGKEKLTKKMDVVTGDNTCLLSIANFSKGVYYLTVVEGSTVFISKKFVKE